MATTVRRPVAILTTRNGQPYVLFGKHIGGDSPYGLSGKTVSEVIEEHGNAPFQIYQIDDGPHIAKWQKLFDQMERDGVVMLATDPDSN